MAALENFSSSASCDARSFCMLAHVDHGKTTLCDYLASYGGALSPSMAGRARLMDVREDEQTKMITVKTSTIALDYENTKLNLVDSPGHIDFSVEVAIALRVCDGAFVIVDVLDGVTPQTEFMLRHAYHEGVRVVLVLNKLDLLFSAQKLEPSEAEQRLRVVIEQCNVIMSVLQREMKMEELMTPCTTQLEHDMLDGAVEEQAWFAPNRGNVAFTSGLLGLGFVLDDFVHFYHEKLGWSISTLTMALWGDFRYDAKKKKVVKLNAKAECTSSDGSNAPSPQSSTLFVKMVLQPLWDVLEAAFSNPRNVAYLKKVAAARQLDIPEKHYDTPQAVDLLHTLFSQWLPLDLCLLRLARDRLPSPAYAQHYRLPTLIPEFETLDASIKAKIAMCDQSSDVCVFYVAKLTQTPGYDGFLCFTRVLCGKLRRGDSVVLCKSVQEISCYCEWITVEELYLFRGCGILPVEEVGAGFICAIGGAVANAVVKNATFASQQHIPPLRPISLLCDSILRTSIRPEKLSELPLLIQGLNLLNRIDPQLQVSIAETGDYIISTAGEVHTERVLTDLNNLFPTEVKVLVSPPEVHFRETIVQGKVTVNPKRWVQQPVSGQPGHICFTQTAGSTTFTGTGFALQLPATTRRLLEERGASLQANFERLQKEIRDSLLPLGGIWELLAAKCEIWCLGAAQGQYTNILFSTTEQNVGGRNALPTFFKEACCTGFLLAMAKGPICEEPVTGIAIVIREASCIDEESEQIGYGVVRSCMKKFCLFCISKHSMRMVEPMYRADFVSDGSCHGTLHGLVCQRRGGILEENPYEGSDRFLLKAMMPVVETIGLALALRVRTSGKVHCTLTHGGWRIVDDFENEDPEHTESPSEPQVHLSIVELVRKRKGLLSHKPAVKAEKQKFSTRAS